MISKNRMRMLIVLLFTGSLAGGMWAQGRSVETAYLDENQTLRVGATVTIKSGLEGLPVVEPHLSAHGEDNDHLLVAAMVVTDVNEPYRSSRLSSFVSVDSGRTWKETQHDYWGYDPWTAIGSKGATAMSWIGTKGSFQDSYPLVFFSSSDGGLTWDSEVQVAAGAHDGTKIDHRGDEFYFSAVRFREDMGADVVLYRRSGQGSFSEVAIVDGEGKRLNFCEPAILSTGKVLVPASEFLRKFWVYVYDSKESKLLGPRLVSSNPGGARGYMRLVCDASENSEFVDRAYFIRATGRGSRSGGVWLNTSADGGENWSADTRIDLFEDPRASGARLACAAVNNEGVLCVSWVDALEPDEQGTTDVFATVSYDGGESFQRPVRVTEVSANERTSSNADVANRFPGGGHYMGIDAKLDGSFQLIWSDSRSGIFELQTCNLTLE